jgi:hypothetical protein
VGRHHGMVSVHGRCGGGDGQGFGHETSIRDRMAPGDRVAGLARI